MANFLVILAVLPILVQSGSVTAINDVNISISTSTEAPLSPLPLKSLLCHVCSYYPGVNWPVDADCMETVNNDRHVKNCSEMITDTMGATRYRCRKTVGKGAGDKLFYIRSCSITSKDVEEKRQDFDQAFTSYCIPNKCNGSSRLIGSHNCVYFIGVILAFYQRICSSQS